MHDMRMTADKLKELCKRLKMHLATFVYPMQDWIIREKSSGLYISEKTFEDYHLWGGRGASAKLQSSFQIEEIFEGDLFLDINLGLSESLESLSFLYGPEAMVFIDSKVCRCSRRKGLNE